jgi:glycosyltransferase involved in cell wall biosynthesis
MRVGIDCRKVADFGIGTYIQGLTAALVELEGDEEYVFFAPGEHRHLLPEGPRVRWVDEDSPKYSLRELFALSRGIEEGKVDLFHAPHYVVPFTERPMVVTIHDLIHLTLPRRNQGERLYALWMIGRAVRKSRTVLTVSEAVAAQIRARYPGSKVTVTPNGVDSRFRPGGGRGDYFLFVGNDKPHKNLATLLTAFRRVRAERPELKLVVAGGASPEEEGVIVAGFVSAEELAALYRQAIALVQPSIEEGFGLPMLEAMASGTAVIASRAPAMMEVASGAAIHVDGRSESALADAMLELAGDDQKRSSLIARGLLRADEFTWRKCAELTLRAYREAWNNVEQPD